MKGDGSVLHIKKLNIILFAVFIFLLLFGTVAKAQVYTVSSNDTLFKISKRTNVPMEKIKSANTLVSDNITTGQVLLIPERYTVQPNDTLYLISRRYGIQLQELKRLNNVGNILHVGQTLYIPQKSPYKVINISKGDSLYKISKRFNVAISDIKRLNGLVNDNIYAGMRLLLPQSSQSSVGYKGSVSRGGVDRDSYIKSNFGIYHTAQDRELLAKLIHAEAEGEPYKGKIAVGAVVINRVKSPKFPNSLKGVIYEVDQSGLYQFCPVREGRLDSAIPSQESFAAADEALSGVDPTGGALFFYNPAKSSNTWLTKKPVAVKIGNHLFIR